MTETAVNRKMAILLSRLEAKKRKPDNDQVPSSIATGSSNKHQKTSYPVTAVVVNSKIFQSSRATVLMLVTKGSDEIHRGQLIRANLDRNLDHRQICMQILPGVSVQANIRVTKGTKQTFYDCQKIEFQGYDLSSLRDLSSSFALPKCGRDVDRYNCMLAMSDDYTDKHRVDVDAPHGIFVERPDATYSDELYEYRRVMKFDISQWGEEIEADKSNIFTMKCRLGLSALACFGVANETHWRNDEYANKWLLYCNYYIRASFSAKDCNTYHEKEDEPLPENLYTSAQDVLIDLPSQVKAIGHLCDHKDVTSLYSHLPPILKKHELGNLNRYTQHPSSPILNVGESDHQINHEKYTYYVVHADGVVPSDEGAVFDLFAIRKD